MTSALRRYSSVAIVMAVTGCQLGCGGTAHDRRPPISATSKSGAPSQGLSARQRRNFEILNTKPEPLLASVKDTLRYPTHGANWSLAQRLDTAGGASIWVVPANEALCLVGEQARGAVSVTCTPTTEALKHGLVTTSLDDGTPGASPARRVIVGVAPDGVTKVRIETPGFRSATVPVTRNTFLLRDSVGKPPEALKLLRAR